MIELTRPAETARDFFAGNPDPLEADEFAMGLLDSIEAYQPGEATGGVQGEAMVSEFLEQGVVSDPLEGYNNALADYRDYATQQGRQPFELADVVLRRKEAGENRFHLRELGAFLKHGTDSEPVFEHMAKRYGLDVEGYREVRQMKGLKEKVFADILTQEITGMNDDIGRATLAKELGLDSWEPQAVLATAPAYIKGKQKIVDTFADIPERAFSEALADESDVEMKWLDDINDPAIARQASALYANELKKFRGRYREFLPLLKPFIDGADEVNPLDKIDDLTAIRYSELDADQRQRFQEAFHYLTNQSETETASKLASPFKAAGRGIESIVKGGSLFLLRQERRDAEAIIKTGKVVEKVGSGPRKKDEGAFDWVTRDATEEEVLKAKRTVGILEMVEDLKSARDVVKPLDNSNLAMRGLNMIAGSVPHMLAFSNPVSGTIAGTSYMQDARTRLRNENPDLSPETLDNLSVAIGGAETAIQQVEFLTLGLGGTGKAIIPKGLLSKRFAELIKTKGLKTIEGTAKAAGEFGKRATSTAALETIEEVSQEFAYDIGKEIGQNFDNQIPDARFGETMAQIAETAPELIITGLFFGAVGATGSVRSDMKLGKILKETKDSGERYVSGLSEVSWQRVDATETDIEAAQVYRREWERTSPQERNRNIANATPEQIAQERSELEEQLGEEAALATNLEEVQEVTAELLGYHRDAGGRVSTEQRQEGDIPIRELENKDGSNRSGLVESARISLESSGVDTSTISDEQIWTQATANGMVIPGKRLGEFVIKFGENADSAVVTEEFAEFFKRDQVAKGVVTDLEIGENLLAYQRNVDSNAKFVPDNFEQMTEAQQAKASTEGFSSFVKAYAMAEARLPDSRLSETFTRSFVRMFEKALDYLKHLIGASTRMMDAIQSGQIKDHSELVTMAERALGLDIDYVAEYQRRELDGLEESFKPLDVASKVRGKLPRPDDPIIAANPETGKEADPLVGELEGIWDALTQEAKDGKINRSRAVAFFAKKGEGVELDRLRQQVNENLREDESAGALEFETPTQMLEAVLGSLEGETSFAVTLETQTALQKRIIEQFEGVGVDSDKVAKLMARKVSAIEESYRKSIALGTYDKATAVSMALGRLSAIRDSLPIAIRHKIGGDRKISELKTEAARERELMERLHKAGLELEKYLVKEYRDKIDKTLKKSQPKDNDNRTVKGKIGALGHEVAQAVTKYKTFDVDQAEAEAAKLEEELAEIESPSLEQFERINALQQSAHLFHDFEHADSGRLEQALEFVRTNYAVGRNEWIEVLQERKVKREQAVSDALAAMEAPAGITRAMLNKAEREAKEQKGLASMDEAFLQSLGSNHHAFARIVESAKDKEAGRKWYNALLDSRIKADMRGEEETEIAQEGFMGHLRDILNVKSGHAVRKWIYDSKQTVQEPGVTSVEGRVKQFVTVDIKLVDAMIRGEVAAKGKSKGEEVTLDERDMAYLRDALDEFEALPDNVQRTRRVIRFERVIARGKRSSIGPLSQSNALMQWLTMRQADQRAKLEEIGFDSRTYAELEKFLKPETKAMGLWMVDYLKEMGVDLNRIHSLEYGVGMISHVNYFPVRNQVAGEITELSMDNPAQGRTMAPGALKSRVANRAEMDLNADAFAVFFAHVAEMGYWRQNVSWVREWGGVFKSPDFANAMKVKVGAKAYRNLTTYMGTIQNRGRQMGGAMMDGERFIKKLMSNSALAILGSRMSTIWINASAVFNSIASPDVSTKELLQNSLELIFDGKGDIKATWQNELQQMRRRQGASFEAQLAGKSSNAGHWLTQDSNALAQKGLAPMNEVDVGMNTLAIAALHRAARKKAELSGLESEAALIEADSAVTRAVATLAQPTLTVSRSAAEIRFMDNPFGALMMMFKSEVRKNTANNYVALRTLATGKGLTDKKRAARIAFFYTVLYPALVAGMRELYKQLTDDEDKEDTLERMKDWKFWTYAMASDNFAGVPFFGDAASSLLAHQMDQQYWENRNLLARQAQDSMKALGVILDDKNQSPSEMADALIDSSQGAGSLFPGLATLAQAANVAEFGKKVVENGIGWELSEEDRLMRLEKGIQDNKSDIYEKFQVGEERHHAFAEYLKEFVQPADLEIILERDANRKTEGGEPASRRIPQAVRSQLEELANR